MLNSASSGFGLDSVIGEMNNRRQAKMQERDRQWRYRMTLAHANRIATLGQMSTSIVHEIKQPVEAAVTNAQAALRFLEGPTPNLEEIRQALTRIPHLGRRVVELVGLEAHEGRLWASLREPRCATFQLTLPLHSDGPSPERDRSDE